MLLLLAAAGKYHHEDGEDSDTGTDDGNYSDGAGEDEDAEALGEATQAEQRLPSGAGKSLWTDGSMYEGAWRRGHASGHGKFSWTSDATYEGDFAGGYC